MSRPGILDSLLTKLPSVGLCKYWVWREQGQTASQDYTYQGVDSHCKGDTITYFDAGQKFCITWWHTHICIYRVSQKKVYHVLRGHNSPKNGTRNKSRVIFEILRSSSFWWALKFFIFDFQIFLGPNGQKRKIVPIRKRISWGFKKSLYFSTTFCGDTL